MEPSGTSVCGVATHMSVSEPSCIPFSFLYILEFTGLYKSVRMNEESSLLTLHHRRLQWSGSEDASNTFEREEQTYFYRLRRLASHSGRATCCRLTWSRLGQHFRPVRIRTLWIVYLRLRVSEEVTDICWLWAGIFCLGRRHDKQAVRSEMYSMVGHAFWESTISETIYFIN